MTSDRIEVHVLHEPGQGTLYVGNLTEEKGYENTYKFATGIRILAVCLKYVEPSNILMADHSGRAV
jgi:hypothetical protein